MSAYVVQVSSGTGPEEVRRFVGLLAAWLTARCEARGLEVRELVTHGDEAAPRSVEIIVEGDAMASLDGERGTHALIDASEARGRASRKRWFAGVSVHPLEASLEAKDEDARVNPDDLEITATRASGPGGQHVNKTSTAVRVLHRPTGVVVRVANERSQRANIRQAVARIAERLGAREASRRAAGEKARRGAHYRVERGAPVMTYRIGRKGDLEPLSPLAPVPPVSRRGDPTNDS
jgi:peptide chain release factor